MTKQIKRALLIGINEYAMPGNNLRGCVNDALLMGKLLTENFGFYSQDIRLLIDKRATAANMRSRLDWLVHDVAPGSTLFFHYSGHGSQVRDRNNDELDDGLDEILCPYDLDWDDPFTDDELARAIEKVPDGVNLTLVLDCCHSGTGTRELFFKDRGASGSTRGRFLVPPPDIGFRMASGVELSHGVAERTVNMTGIRSALKLRHFGSCITSQNAVLISGCRSDQTSADAWIENDYRGALTYSLFRTLRAKRYSISNFELVREAGNWLEANRYDQVPQIECPAARRDWTFLGHEAHPQTVAVATGGLLPITDRLPDIADDTRVVFIHGIGDHASGYSNRWRAAFNRHLGLPLDNYVEVVWDGVFDRSRSTSSGRKAAAVPSELSTREKKDAENAAGEIRALLEARQDIIEGSGLGEWQRNGSPRDSADRAADRGFLDWLVNFDEYIGDFLKYIASKRVRDAVDGRLEDKLAPLIRSRAPIVLISHSWGTVVAHNVMQKLETKGHIGLHATLGSPLWMAPVRRMLNLERDRGAAQTWINVDAEGDLIGGALHRWFDVTHDYQVPTVGGQAHSSYFHPDNEFVQRDIVAHAIRTMDRTYLRDVARATEQRRRSDTKKHIPLEQEGEQGV